MTLRPEYSLGHSPYNAFLFAAVGEEQVGVPLTVLSALTRLGFDPWQEAARLAGLPRETAAQVFAVTIAMLPEGGLEGIGGGDHCRASGELAARASPAGHPPGARRICRRQENEAEGS